MTPKQKAKKWVKENGGTSSWECSHGRHFDMDAKMFHQAIARAYLAGYEQGEYDLYSKQMTAAWREYAEKYAKRYDLQDGNKK